MTNFFEELKRFIEMNNGGNTHGLFFEYAEAKIPYSVAEDIYYLLVGQEEWTKEIEETIEEQRDFIRLLREENKRLRGSNDNGE